MSFQKVEAGRGVEWLKQSIELNLKNPGIFVVNALIFMVLCVVVGIIPLLNLITLPLGIVALTAGALWAYREEAEGRKAEVPHLFAAFQQPGKIGPVLMLALPWIAAMVLIIVLVFVLGGAALLSLLAGAGANSAGGAMAGVGLSALLFVLIYLAILLAAAMLTFFAIPRVMFDGVEPFAAMKESLAACLGNFVPLLIYGLIVFVASIVLGFVLGLIPFLGPLVLGIALSMLHMGFCYLAYRDVFGQGGAAAAGYAPPPPPM